MVGEDRPLDADGGEGAHGVYSRDASPRRRRPARRASTMTTSPAGTPSRISTRSPTRRPVRTRCSWALPSFDDQDLLDAGERRTSADCGTTSAWRLRSVTISACANVPGRSVPSWIGHFGFDRQRAVAFGDRRAETRDAAFVDGRIAFDRHADHLARACTSVGARSGTASCSRSGCWRTTVTIGVPAARILAGERHAVRARRRRSASAAMVSSSCWRASASSERRCASTAWRLRTSSSAS